MGLWRIFTIRVDPETSPPGSWIMAPASPSAAPYPSSGLALKGLWQILTRADKVLILSVLVCTVGLLFYQNGNHRQSLELVVFSNGTRLGPFLLSESRVLRFKGPLGVSEVEIAGRAARITKAPCPRKICVRMGWIRQPGEASVCLPNHLVIQARGTHNGVELDAVSQ